MIPKHLQVEGKDVYTSGSEMVSDETEMVSDEINDTTDKVKFVLWLIYVALIELSLLSSNGIRFSRSSSCDGSVINPLKS